MSIVGKMRGMGSEKLEELYRNVFYLQIPLKRRSFSVSNGATIPIQRRSHFGRTALPPDKGLPCP